VKTIEQIRRQLANGEFDFNRHPLKRAVERNIAEREIREAAGNAQIIEDIRKTSIRQVV
jgi:RNase P protein component